MAHSNKNKVINAFTSIDWQDVGSRALWTFVQVFLAAFLFAGESIINALFAGDFSGSLTLAFVALLSAVAAGLSVLKTITLEVIAKLRENIK